MIAIASLSLVCGIAFADKACSWQVKLGAEPSVELNGQQLRIDKALSRKLRGANQAELLPASVTMFNGDRAKWVVLRSPSSERGDAGFCGAGHEDRLVLLDVKAATVRLVGEFLAQSCLSSISMNADQMDELVRALDQDPADGSFVFRQTVSSDLDSFTREVKINVVHGRLRMTTRKVQVDE